MEMEQIVDYTSMKDDSGVGEWTVILKCPNPQNQELQDLEKGVSGPSFMTCAYCPNQIGENLYSQDDEGAFFIAIYPQRLKCGYVPPAAEPE